MFAKMFGMNTAKAMAQKFSEERISNVIPIATSCGMNIAFTLWKQRNYVSYPQLSTTPRYKK